MPGATWPLATPAGGLPFDTLRVLCDVPPDPLHNRRCVVLVCDRGTNYTLSADSDQGTPLVWGVRAGEAHRQGGLGASVRPQEE